MILIRPTFEAFVPMGMTKVSPNQAVAVSTTNTQIIGWSAHSSYPSSQIVNNSLVTVGAARVNINLSVNYSFASPAKHQIMVNGIEIWSEQFTGSGGTRTYNVETDLYPGDLVSFYVTNPSSTLPHQVNYGASTFMVITPI